jgi:hypothetical protein
VSFTDDPYLSHYRDYSINTITWEAQDISIQKSGKVFYIDGFVNEAKKRIELARIEFETRYRAFRKEQFLFFDLC